MTNQKTDVTVGGGNASVFLFIVLFILKINPGGHLDNPVEDWSWWLITLPLWIGLAILMVVVLIGLSGAGVAKVLDARAAKKRRKAAWERINKRADRPSDLK